MSWRDNLIEARERLARLEAAEETALVGGQVEQISSGGETLKYAQRPSSLADLKRAIAETKMVIRRLEGGRGGGAIVPVFCG